MKKIQGGLYRWITQREDYKSNYIDSPNTPLYPFGHGLSYTNFSFFRYYIIFSNKIGVSDTLTVSVNIKNAGNYDGDMK